MSDKEFKNPLITAGTEAMDLEQFTTQSAQGFIISYLQYTYSFCISVRVRFK